MGQADTATARYLRRNEIFADMFNFFLYNGKEVIDPDSLQELNIEMRPYVPEYRINLIEPAAITDDVFENFHSTLKEVLEFIKYSTDPDKLMNVVDADEAFQHLGRTEMGVLRACVNKNLSGKQDKEEEGTINMKDAITILEERAEEKEKQREKQKEKQKVKWKMLCRTSKV